MAKTITEFKLDEKTKQELTKQLIELKAFCERNRIPFFVAALISNTNEDSEYKSEIFSPTDAQLVLTHDLITQHLNVALGLYDNEYEKIFDGSYEELLEQY